MERFERTELGDAMSEVENSATDQWAEHSDQPLPELHADSKTGCSPVEIRTLHTDTKAVPEGKPRNPPFPGRNRIAETSETAAMSHSPISQSMHMFQPNLPQKLQALKMPLGSTEAYSEEPFDATAFWKRDKPSWGTNRNGSFVDVRKAPHHQKATMATDRHQEVSLPSLILQAKDMPVVRNPIRTPPCNPEVTGEPWPQRLKSFHSEEAYRNRPPTPHPSSPFKRMESIPAIEPDISTIGSLTAESTSSREESLNTRHLRQVSKTAERQVLSTVPAHLETAIVEDAAHGSEKTAALDSISDYDECFQFISRYMRQRQEAALTEYEADRKSLHAELQKSSARYLALQDTVKALQSSKTTLTSTVDEQKQKIAMHEAKIMKFKTFIDGLGKDFDSLKKEANWQRQQGEELLAVMHERNAEQSELVEQVSKLTENSSRLKRKAAKAFGEAELEITATKTRCNYLEKQLHDNAGLLVEERDFRAQLQAQLTSSGISSDAVLQELKSNNAAVLDKLLLIDAEIGKVQAHQYSTELLDGVAESVQNLGLQQSTAEKDATTIKILLTTLFDRFAEYQNGAVPAQALVQASETSLRSFFTDALDDLKLGLHRQEELITQESAYRTTIEKLEEELKASNQRVSESSAQLLAIRGCEQLLVTQNTSLKNDLTNYERTMLPELKNELQLKINALEITKSELQDTKSKLDVETSSTANLRGQIDALQKQIEESSHYLPDFTPEREQLQREAQAKIESIRTDLSERARIFHAEYESKMQNQVRKLTVELEDAGKEIETLKAANNKVENSVEDTDEQLPSKEIQNVAEIQRLEAIVQVQSAKISHLHTSITKAENIIEQDLSRREEYNIIQFKHQDLEAELAFVLNQKAELLTGVDNLRTTIEEMNVKEVESRTRASELQSKNHERIEALTKRLEDTNKVVMHLETEANSLRMDHEAVLEKQRVDAQNEIDVLQYQLEEARMGLTKIDRGLSDRSPSLIDDLKGKYANENHVNKNKQVLEDQSKGNDFAFSRTKTPLEFDTGGNGTSLIDGSGLATLKTSAAIPILARSTGITTPSTVVVSTPENPRKGFHQRLYNALDPGFEDIALLDLSRTTLSKSLPAANNNDTNNDDMLDSIPPETQVSRVPCTQSDDPVLSFAAFNAGFSALQPSMTYPVDGSLCDANIPTLRSTQYQSKPDNEVAESTPLSDYINIKSPQNQDVRSTSLADQGQGQIVENNQKKLSSTSSNLSLVHSMRSVCSTPKQQELKHTQVSRRMTVRLQTPQQRNKNKPCFGEDEKKQDQRSPQFVHGTTNDKENPMARTMDKTTPLSQDFAGDNHAVERRPKPLKRKAEFFETVEYEHTKTRRVYSRDNSAGSASLKRSHETRPFTPANRSQRAVRDLHNSMPNQKVPQTKSTPSGVLPSVGRFMRPSKRRRSTKGDEMNARFSKELEH